MEIAACFLVSGKVQGVFFRASTCEQARRLGLRGHARNHNLKLIDLAHQVIEGSVAPGALDTR